MPNGSSVVARAHGCGLHDVAAHHPYVPPHAHAVVVPLHATTGARPFCAGACGRRCGSQGRPVVVRRGVLLPRRAQAGAGASSLGPPRRSVGGCNACVLCGRGCGCGRVSCWEQGSCIALDLTPLLASSAGTRPIFRSQYPHVLLSNPTDTSILTSQAVKHFTKATQFDPSFAPAWGGLGQAFAVQDEPEVRIVCISCGCVVRACVCRGRRCESGGGVAGDLSPACAGLVPLACLRGAGAYVCAPVSPA